MSISIFWIDQRIRGVTIWGVGRWTEGKRLTARTNMYRPGSAPDRMLQGVYTTEGRDLCRDKERKHTTSYYLNREAPLAQAYGALTMAAIPIGVRIGYGTPGRDRTLQQIWSYADVDAGRTWPLVSKSRALPEMPPGLPSPAV